MGRKKIVESTPVPVVKSTPAVAPVPVVKPTPAVASPTSVHHAAASSSSSSSSSAKTTPTSRSKRARSRSPSSPVPKSRSKTSTTSTPSVVTPPATSKAKTTAKVTTTRPMFDSDDDEQPAPINRRVTRTVRKVIEVSDDDGEELVAKAPSSDDELDLTAHAAADAAADLDERKSSDDDDDEDDEPRTPRRRSKFIDDVAEEASEGEDSGVEFKEEEEDRIVREAAEAALSKNQHAQNNKSKKAAMSVAKTPVAAAASSSTVMATPPRGAAASSSSTSASSSTSSATSSTSSSPSTSLIAMKIANEISPPKLRKYTDETLISTTPGASDIIERELCAVLISDYSTANNNGSKIHRRHAVCMDVNTQERIVLLAFGDDQSKLLSVLHPETLWSATLRKSMNGQYPSTFVDVDHHFRPAKVGGNSSIKMMKQDSISENRRRRLMSHRDTWFTPISELEMTTDAKYANFRGVICSSKECLINGDTGTTAVVADESGASVTVTFFGKKHLQNGLIMYCLMFEFFRSWTDGRTDITGKNASFCSSNQPVAKAQAGLRNFVNSGEAVWGAIGRDNNRSNQSDPELTTIHALMKKIRMTESEDETRRHQQRQGTAAADGQSSSSTSSTPNANGEPEKDRYATGKVQLIVGVIPSTALLYNACGALYAYKGGQRMCNKKVKQTDRIGSNGDHILDHSDLPEGKQCHPMGSCQLRWLFTPSMRDADDMIEAEAGYPTLFQFLLAEPFANQFMGYTTQQWLDLTDAERNEKKASLLIDSREYIVTVNRDGKIVSMKIE